MDAFSDSQYRLGKKRSSLDTSLKQPLRKSKASSRDNKNIIGLKLDINQHVKSTTLSLKPNMTHRVQQNYHLNDLREEVEQLRMENDELKDQIRNFCKVESDLQYNLNKLKNELYELRKKETKYLDEIEKQEERIKQYSEKIKELYEGLINEKKKNIGSSKIRVALSPCHSINSSLNLCKFEREGEKDFYSNATYVVEDDYCKVNPMPFKISKWGTENIESPGKLGRGTETFRSRF